MSAESDSVDEAGLAEAQDPELRESEQTEIRPEDEFSGESGSLQKWAELASQRILAHFRLPIFCSNSIESTPARRNRSRMNFIQDSAHRRGIERKVVSTEAF